jgi:hypothetical protein
MDLSGLNLQPGVGVQAAIRAHYGEPVNHFPVQGLNEFFHIVSVGRCKLILLEKQLDFFFKQLLMDLQLILDRSKSLIMRLDLLWLLATWAFISIISDPSLVKNIIFSLICGIMEVLIGNLNLKSISKKKKKRSGMKSRGRDHLNENLMLILPSHAKFQAPMLFQLDPTSIIHKIFLENRRGMVTLLIGITIPFVHQFSSVLNGQEIVFL